jgi:predicted Zn-dependent protease
MRKALLLAALVSGCAAVPPPEGAPVDEAPVPQPAPQAEAPRPTENVAVAALMTNARADVDANRLGSAAATIERALRLEPRNPRLWHELARVRLKQGEYAQAESTAARSNTWAGSDSELRAANQQIIEQARSARGR